MTKFLLGGGGNDSTSTQLSLRSLTDIVDTVNIAHIDSIEITSEHVKVKATVRNPLSENEAQIAVQVKRVDIHPSDQMKGLIDRLESIIKASVLEVYRRSR